MRVGYLDCSAGVSGDMIVAALLDLGLDFEHLQSELEKLPLEGYRLERRRESRGSITATRFLVEVTEEQPERGLSEVLAIIDGANLAESPKSLAKRIFVRLAGAESRVHGVALEAVHFHEIGAVDSIIDIVGAAIGLMESGVKQFRSSALNLGAGWIESRHGQLPVPAPATVELLKGALVFSDRETGEWTTPTGAAIVSSVVEAFGRLPQMTIAGVGYGAGAQERQLMPNVLRLVVGDAEEPATPGPVRESVSVIEAEIDDLSPQVFGYLMERAMQQGALEIFYTPVQMKKDRPGTQLTIICQNERREELADLVFTETTTIGLRLHEVERRVLDRQQQSVQTPYGAIRVKVAKIGSRMVNCSPEYEDCRKAAERHGVPVRDVLSLALTAFESMMK